MINKRLILTITCLLLLTILTTTAKADEIVTNEQYALLNQQIINENTKTRTELTLYIDRKIAEMITTIETRGQGFIDENFKILDDRIHALAIKVQIQFAITIILAIIFANAIWYWIRRELEKKQHYKIKKEMNKDTLTADKYGLASEEFNKKITKEDETIIKPAVFEEKPENSTIIPPTIDAIQEMMNNIKKEQEEQEKAKLREEQEKKKQEKQRQKQKLLEEMKKLEEKREKKTRKLNQKIEEYNKKLEENGQ